MLELFPRISRWLKDRQFEKAWRNIEARDEDYQGRRGFMRPGKLEEERAAMQFANFSDPRHLAFVDWAQASKLLPGWVLFPVQLAARHIKARKIAEGFRTRKHP